MGTSHSLPFPLSSFFLMPTRPKPRSSLKVSVNFQIRRESADIGSDHNRKLLRMSCVRKVSNTWVLDQIGSTEELLLSTKAAENEILWSRAGGDSLDKTSC